MSDEETEEATGENGDRLPKAALDKDTFTREPIEEPYGECDWGDCEYLAREWRVSPENGERLPVCFKHSEKGEQFYAGLNAAYQNTKGAHA